MKNLSLGLRAASLVEGAQWRDMLALTGTIRTFFPTKCIEAAWSERSQVHEPTDFCTVPGTSRIMRREPKISWVQGAFSFTTHGKPETVCSGLIGLVPDEDSSFWKIWFVITILEQIHGLKNVDVLDPESTPATNGKNGAMQLTDDNVNRTCHINGSEATDHADVNGNAKSENLAKINGQTRTNGHPESNNITETNGRSRTNGYRALSSQGEAHGSTVTNGNTAMNGHPNTNGHIEFGRDKEPYNIPEANGNKNTNEPGLTSTGFDFDCVVCGGGQAGLVVAGRLKAGGITNCIAIDRNDTIGGNWLARYDSVKCNRSPVLLLRDPRTY